MPSHKERCSQNGFRWRTLRRSDGPHGPELVNTNDVIDDVARPRHVARTLLTRVPTRRTVVSRMAHCVEEFEQLPCSASGMCVATSRG